MDLITEIKNKSYFSYDDSFRMALQCGKLLTGNDSDHLLARRIIIHVLDKWDDIPKATHSIWGDVIEAVGFYPYISKNSDTIYFESFADKVRQNSFLSDYLPNTYMHLKQKQLSDYLRSDKNIIASAPTSFGKSLLIEELVASLKYQNIIIIQPTLALLDETRIKLKKYNKFYKIIVRTSQEPSNNKGNLFLLTAERVMEYAHFSQISLLIIDEFYKMSLKRIDERADTLNNAFLKIYNAFNPKFYLLGPNIDGITKGFSEKYNALFFKTDYSLVDCDIIPVNTKGLKKEEKNQKLFELLDSQSDEQTLIFCSSPSRARKLAREYFFHLDRKGVLESITLPVIEWLDVVLPNWLLTKELSLGIAVHDGSLPKHLGTSIIQCFNDEKIRYIFCTSTIIEGVNTNAKNVVIFDGKKGSKEIDYFDYSNIKGRSGRLMKHYLGNVYCFNEIPLKSDITIDIPFFEQEVGVLTDEILVNIKKEDVQPQMVNRYDNLSKIDPELLKIIKANGTNINGQLTIYYALERDLTKQISNIVWTQIPNWSKIEYILTIAENNTFKIDRRGIFSVRQLTRYLDMYRKNKSILHIVKDIYESKSKKKMDLDKKEKYIIYDEAIEIAFHIYRHWFQFTIPKTFRVVDSLQRYVCEKHNIKSGSYSYFVQQLENDFIRENLSILVEYGIPSETARKLTSAIPDNLSDDGVIQFIYENKSWLYERLMQYERDRLDQCL